MVYRHSALCFGIKAYKEAVQINTLLAWTNIFYIIHYNILSWIKGKFSKTYMVEKNPVSVFYVQ